MGTRNDKRHATTTEGGERKRDTLDQENDPSEVNHLEDNSLFGGSASKFDV